MRLIVSVLLALTVLSLSACGSGSETTGTFAGGSSTEPVEATSPEPSPTWQKVITMKGSGSYSRNTEPFILYGGEQRLVGTVKVQSAYGSVSWQPVHIATDTGGSVVSVSESEKLDTRFYLPDGKYYMWGVGNDCTWSVTLYELR